MRLGTAPLSIWMAARRWSFLPCPAKITGAVPQASVTQFIAAIAFGRHARARQSPSVGHGALDRQDGAALGAIVEHLLGDDPCGEVAERDGYRAVAGFLAPGDHAVAGHEVGSGLDRRIGRCGRRPAFDHPEARAAQLALQIPQADPGVLQLSDRTLVGRRIVLANRDERGQRLAFERCARVDLGPVDDLAQSGFAFVLARSSASLGIVRGAVGGGRLEPLSAGDPDPHRLGAGASQHVEPVHVLTRIAGQGDEDLEMLLMGASEGAGRLLARLKATIVGWPVLVPVGRDRDPSGRRPRKEGADTARRQGRGDRELAGFDLGLCASARAAEVSIPSASSRCGAVAGSPQTAGAAGGALALGQPSRFLRVTLSAVRAGGELGLSSAARGYVDPVRMRRPSGATVLEHRAWEVPDQRRPVVLLRGAGRSRRVNASRPPGSTAAALVSGGTPSR